MGALLLVNTMLYGESAPFIHVGMKRKGKGDMEGGGLNME